MVIKAVELIVSGEVQEVGYRNFVARVARRLKLVGTAENLKDGTVKIRCKGEATIVEKFKELINIKNPSEAPLIEVENIAEKQLKETEITEATFEEQYGNKDVELLQTVSTGTRYIGHLSKKIDNLGVELGNKIDTGFNKIGKELGQFRTESNSNFQELGVKYGKISNTMERIDKNIEKIAKKNF